jgi:hypothetical protein
MSRCLVAVACFAALATLTACPADDACIEVDVSACTPLYAPTFDNVFSRTLEPTCGVAGSSCHSAAGAKAGLVFEDADDAYDALLDGRVEPGDPGCSLIVRRLESSDRSFKMPPGSRVLDEGERCSIERWIATGAER